MENTFHFIGYFKTKLRLRIYGIILKNNLNFIFTGSYFDLFTEIR